MTIPNLQKQRIIEYLKQGKRFDGRKTDEYREIKIELGISENAEGSCSVKFGNTEVWAGVKMEVLEPYPDSPDKGNFVTTVELSPMASEEFESGPPRIEAIELGRIIDRGIRESGFIEFEKLCIKQGEKVWQIYLDLYAINDDGNLMDCAALAGLIALASAKMPVYNEETGKPEHELSKENLPLNKDAMAFNITLHKIDDHIIADVSKEEEDSSDWRISLAVADNNGEPRITAMQKGKKVAMDEEEIEKVLNLVEEKFKEIMLKINKIVWGK